MRLSWPHKLKSRGRRKQKLVFTTTAETVLLPVKEHFPFRVEVGSSDTQEPSPYVRVRTNLDALNQPQRAFTSLVELALNASTTQDVPGVWSREYFFPI